MNNQAASDFCFHVFETDGGVFACINSLERYKQEHYLDDSSEFDDVIDGFLPDGVDQVTDSTWCAPEYCTGLDDVEEFRAELLKCGFVEDKEFSEFMMRQ